MDFIVRGENCTAGVRAVGVLIKDNKILIQREKGGNEYALPGGHIKLGETIEESLIREYKEETGADIKCIRLLWTEESFWNYNGKSHETIAFYYLIELCNNQEIADNGEFISQKDNCNVVLGWTDIENIKNMTIYPSFLKDTITNIKDYPEHFISRD